MNGMMTSPQTLLCQRQQVTCLVPSLLCKHQSTFRPRPQCGARSRAGPTRLPTPGSPLLLPTLPASLSHTLRTRTWSKEEAAKMETKISGMLTHSRIPGCFPGRACAAGRATPPTRCLLRWAGRETQEEWEPAPGSVGLSAGAHGRKPGWGGVVLASHWLPRDSSHLPETLAHGELGAPSCFWFPCGVLSVHTCASVCARAQRTHGENWHQ